MNQATHNKVVSFLWGKGDDMHRVLFNRGNDSDVVLPMCVLRDMYAVLEPMKRGALKTKVADGLFGEIIGGDKP